MSKKDCIRIRRSLKYHLEAEDMEALDTEYNKLKKGGIPKAEAYMEAAETVMDGIVGERNTIAAEVRDKGGYMEDISLENLVNPASYSAAPTGGAADIGKVSTEDFDALLEEVAPATEGKAAPKAPEPKAAPAKDAASAFSFIRLKKGTRKGMQGVNVKDLKQAAKAAGLDGYSSMKKDELITALDAWYEAEWIAKFPEPATDAAEQLRAAFYTREDSSMGVVVSSTDPAMAHFAVHYGASQSEKTMNTFEGGKTGKGRHFQKITDFDKFVQQYTGLTPVEEDRLTNGGEPIHLNYQGREITDPTETHAVGDKVNIVRHGDAYTGVSGEVVGSETDPVDGREMYAVAFTDPDGQEFEEMFDATELEPAQPIKPRKEAKDILKEAAKHGVSGADEALTGLANLFGGKSKFSSGFTFDEDTYAKAKPHFKKALEEFIAAGKSLKEFVAYILDNFGEGIKPYLKQFHSDIADDTIEIRGINDVQSTPQEQAAVSQPSAELADQGDITDAGAGTAEVSGQATARPAAEEGIAISSIGLPVDSTNVAGEQGNIEVLGNTGEFSTTDIATGLSDTGRGAAAGAEGVFTESPGSKTARSDAKKTVQRLKQKPTTSAWIQSDPANIAETVPQLFPEQQDDVVFAEQRIFDNGHRGVLFTNGTGTGKTFTGLGLVKRMVMQGKDNIIIVVPGEKVAADWIKSGKSMDLPITKLKGIKDAGQGVVITTYANIAENDAIVKRNWDMVVHDEAHKLSENAAGNSTNALNKSRALTGHPNGSIYYAQSMERPLLDDMKTKRDQIEHYMAEAQLNPEQAGMFADLAEKVSDELAVLEAQWREKSNEHRLNRAELWKTNTPKRLDLTATPFAYDKSVDHAEGFLFNYDWSLNEQSRGYNQPDAHDSFFVEHFGYRMRYGKLTQPEADVDSALMQREFNQWMKDNGALRGRRLTVDHDYSRQFIAIDDLVGTKIDEGLQLIRDRAGEKDNANQLGYQLMEKKLRKYFNYHARVKLLEAIKAGHAVKRARDHMALGRKVVIFHSRIQGGTINPFSTFVPVQVLDVTMTAQGEQAGAAEIASYNNAVAEFNAERQDLVTLKINQIRPLDLFAQEFGDQMTTYNGTISNKAKRENPDTFNRDDAEVQVIVVQDQGGKEGISLHDATGANQRVLMNLGLPVQPTQAIQIEGRIYRVGQQSNALFEYFNTGTSFERMTFAEKISERASTAENLALGDEARALKDSFIDAFEDPSFEPPSDGQGVGGRDQDEANWGATSEFERAKTHYFGTLKTQGKRDQRAGLDYYATPEPVGLKMVEWAGLRPNESFLEPSAGHGAIARYVPENVAATYVEPSSDLLSRLALRAAGNHRQMRFEDLDVGGNKYNAIVMNPPYGAGGSTAIAHLQKAMHHLKNGGRVVALIPEGPAADKKFESMFYGKEGELESLREKVKAKRKAGTSFAEESRRIEDLTKYFLRADISLPPITFTRAGTAIRSHVVIIDKVMNDNISMVQQPKREVHADTINELFDTIEGFNVPERTALQQTPEEYLEAEGLQVTHVEADDIYRITGQTFEHKELIKKALGVTEVSFDRPAQAWVTKEDPTNALYQEFTNPQVAAEAREAPPSQDEIRAAAAALFSGRQGQIPAVEQLPLGGLTVTEGETKAGKQVWEVTGNTREHKEMLKSMGGRWYGPKKAWSFYNADPTERISSELSKPQASRAARKGGSTPAQVKQWLKTPLKRISSRVPVEVVRRKEDIKTEYELAEDAKGWYIDGKVYLVAENIRDQKDAVIAFTHEVVGHLGIEGVLGRRKMNELIGDITNMKLDVMFGPTAHPEIEKILSMLRRYYVDKDGKYSLNAREEAKEVIAVIAEQKPRIGALVELYNKIMLWFRQALLKFGIGDPGMVKIEEALVRAAEFTKTPPSHYTGQGPDGAAAMRAWAGAKDIFEEFKTAYIGVGEDLRGYGWGLYFGSQKQVAEHYRSGDAFLAAEMVSRHGEVNAVHRIQNQIDKEMANLEPNQRFIEQRRKVIEQIRSGEYQGNVYEVELAPTEEEMIDWNAELEDQPQIVQDAFLTLLGGTPQEFEGITYYEDLRGTGGELYRKVEALIKSGEIPADQIIGYDPYEAFPKAEPDQVTSLVLLSMGIRGNQYLDLGSRDTAQQTKNYVVFDDTDITILGREGPEQVEEAPLASRTPPEPEEPSQHELEALRKLGLAPKDPLWKKISDVRMGNITNALDDGAKRSYEGLFDGLIGLKRAEVEAGVGMGAEVEYVNPKTGKTQRTKDYANSAYISTRFATGVADMMSHILHFGALSWRGNVVVKKEGTVGLLELFGQLGVKNLNDWLMWMGANRAQQLMRQGRERNLTEDEIAAGLAKAGPEGSAKYEKFMTIKEKYAEMNAAMLDFAETAGLIDAIKRQEWESSWYVPFYRMSEEEVQGPRVKRGLSHQDAGIRRLFGADIPTNDLLENIMMNWLKLTDASAKNQAIKQMVNNFSETDLITNESMRFTRALVPKSEIRKRVMADRAFAIQVADYLGMEETANNLEIINEVNTIPSEGFEQLWALTAPKDPDIIRVKRGGKNEYWRVHNKPLLRAIGHMDNQSPKALAGFRWFKRLLTTGVTASPDFMLRNFIRDAQQAYTINPDDMWFGADSMKGLKEAMLEGPIYQAMMAAGVSFQGGYVHATDPAASAQILRRELKKAGLTDAQARTHTESILHSPVQLKNLVGKGWQHYRSWGDKVENANRAATAMAGMDSGKPMAQWLFEAKDLMDYSRRGNFTALIWMTDVIPFLNARLQGIDKLGRAGKEYKLMVARKMAYMAVFSVILAELNDDDERYKALPDWEKDAYWHIFLDDFGEASGHWRIPKGFEIGLIAGTMPERMWRTWKTKSQPSEKLVWSMNHGLWETLALNPIPQAVLPMAETWANRSWYFDQPIESESDKGVSPRKRYNGYTSSTAMAMGDNDFAEWMGMSPKRIQHIWNGYTGTMGAYALQLADIVTRNVGDFPETTPLKPHEVPMAKSIYQGDRVKRSQYETDFYDRLREVRELHGDVRKALRERDLEGAREIRAENKGKLKMRKTMENRAKLFAQLRGRRDQILRNDDLTPADKYQKSQAIQVKINNIAKQIEAHTRAAFTE